jgi:hypothetical protein
MLREAIEFDARRRIAKGDAVSLFEDDNYVYRDTFFIYLKDEHRPTAQEVKECIEALGDKYETSSLKDDQGKFDSITIRSPYDSSAMDIAFIQGEEVLENVAELMRDFRTITLSGDDHKKLKALSDCNARFDVFHFEQKPDDGDDEAMLDPGGLLLVMERLASVSQGVGLDPQSKTLF